MLSEYQLTCPKCGDPRAKTYREWNSRGTQLYCSRCGYKKEYLLPPFNDSLVREVFAEGKRRVYRRASLQRLRRSALPILLIISFYSIFQDAKLTITLLGVLVIGELSPSRVSISTQLTYILRLLQQNRVMDGDLNRVVETGEPDAADILRDYELAAVPLGGSDDELSRNRYFAFVNWLGASLRALGCSSEMIDQGELAYQESIQKILLKRDGEKL